MHEWLRLISSHATLKCLLTLHGHLSFEFLFTLASHHSFPLPLGVVYQNKIFLTANKKKGVNRNFLPNWLVLTGVALHTAAESPQSEPERPALLTSWIIRELCGQQNSCLKGQAGSKKKHYQLDITAEPSVNKNRSHKQAGCTNYGFHRWHQVKQLGCLLFWRGQYSTVCEQRRHVATYRNAEGTETRSRKFNSGNSVC